MKEEKIYFNEMINKATIEEINTNKTPILPDGHGDFIRKYMDVYNNELTNNLDKAVAKANINAIFGARENISTAYLPGKIYLIIRDTIINFGTRNNGYVIMTDTVPSNSFFLSKVFENIIDIEQSCEDYRAAIEINQGIKEGIKILHDRYGMFYTAVPVIDNNLNVQDIEYVRII